MPPLIFYFPFPSAGGVSVLFLRIAEKLSRLGECTLVDLPDGFMARNCPPSVRLWSALDRNPYPPDGIFITQTCPPWRLPCFQDFPESMKLFFWNLHPDNLIASLVTGNSGRSLAQYLTPLDPLLSFARRRKLSGFLRLAVEHHGIAFMDLMNVEKTKKSLAVDFEPMLLPICTGEAATLHRCSKKKTGLSCVWLGRLESFKTPVLLHLMNRLDAVNTFPITLTLLGDGGDSEFLQERARRLQRLKCKFAGAVSLREIDASLQGHDVLFAMGTSALEGARLGLPTFCLDYSHLNFEGFLRFRLLYDVRGLNLGEEIDESHKEPSSTLENTLVSIMRNHREYGDHCYEYWRKHHSLEQVSRDFINVVASSNLQTRHLVAAGLFSPDVFTQLKSRFCNASSFTGWSYC